MICAGWLTEQGVPGSVRFPACARLLPSPARGHPGGLQAMNSVDLKSRLRDAHRSESIILVILIAERLIAKGADEGWIFEVYASSLIGMGRYGEAEGALDRAEQLASAERLPWVIHRRAHLERQRGNLQEALNLWKGAHAQNPDEATFPIFAATVAHKLGRLGEAEALARTGTGCSAGFPDEAWYNLGGYLAAQQRYDEALECYERAIEIDPEYEIAKKRRSELLEAFEQGWGRAVGGSDAGVADERSGE